MRWLKRLGIVLLVIVALVAAAYMWATANTDSSQSARVIAWMDADVDDWQRFPMRTLAASDEPLQLPPPAEPNAAIAAFEVDGKALPQFLADNDTTAFLVARDGELVYEEYYNESSRDAIQTSFSTAKSFASTLVGIAIADGLLSLDDPVSRHIPELLEKDGRFAEITVRDLHLDDLGPALRGVPAVGRPGGNVLRARPASLRAQCTSGGTGRTDVPLALGYPRSYPTFVRGVRAHRLRPHCEPCHGVRGRLTIEIDHPPGAEIQWDWFERRRAPWGGTAYVLLGTLPHSGRVRGVLAESMDQAHLIEAMDAVLRRLGGTARDWRTDRLATVIVPGSADVQPSFAPVAKHYGVTVRPCPPRRGNRKGAVEASVRYLCGRWWRTMTATTTTTTRCSSA